MNRPKRTKIYYTPVMISLVFVPIAFLYFAIQDLERKPQTYLSIFLADRNYGEKFAKDHPGKLLEYHGHYPPVRNYALINFTGQKENDELKLKFASLRVGEIVSSKDTLEGLHFVFNDSSEFSTFIKTMNIFKFQLARTYMITEKEIWFYHIHHAY